MKIALNLEQQSLTAYESVLNAKEFPGNVKHYWGYQYRLAKEVLVPYLQREGVFRAGQRVVEIGCAEAGVLMAFTEAGAVDVLGTDIEKHRLEYGQRIADTLKIPLTLSTHNVLFDELQPAWQKAFDLVILRDVIEHLDDTRLALANIQRLLKPGGHVFIEFPPYSSPYGGHQHLLRNRWGKLPYVHLLPKKLFRAMTSSGWHPLDIEEVRRLADIRLTVKSFKRAAHEAQYTIQREQYFFLRPVFKMKFGLPTVPLTPLRGIPGVKEILSLEANYILKSTLL
ncbi:MAG: class I SAM-dependent methyltransferase [Candidatus Kapabacteria bacterium]|nr:class I SAM-dependent methyltransferase [Candidatus Kapabacteria bacterium]